MSQPVNKHSNDVTMKNEYQPLPVADRLVDVGEYYFSGKLREIEEMNRVVNDVINLGIGSPDLPPQGEVIIKLRDEAMKPNTHAYQSYKGSPVLRKAFADWYKKWYDVSLDPDQEILPLIGSKEGIMHICMTYVNPGDPVLIPNPGYPTYQSAAKIAGAKIAAYSLTAENNWYPNFKALEETLQKLKDEVKDWKGCLMFVNYPHMPTGQLPSRDLFTELVAFAKRHNLLLVNDNPYSFILNDTPMSLLGVEGAKDVVIELNSLSKSHNMAGWRIGVAVAARRRIEEIMRFKSNMDSGMFLPLQLAAARALESGPDWFDELNKTYGKRRETVYDLLKMLKCNFDTKQAGMFVWASIPAEFENSYTFSDSILQSSNVFLTPGGIFGSEGDKYIRVSLCTQEARIREAIDRISMMKNKL
ncbi:aminotransferase class I/II-fold pyridoxal phosphate-dependent enzyme [soil metagenome]